MNARWARPPDENQEYRKARLNCQNVQSERRESNPRSQLGKLIGAGFSTRGRCALVQVTVHSCLTGRDRRRPGCATRCGTLVARPLAEFEEAVLDRRGRTLALQQLRAAGQKVRDEDVARLLRLASSM